MSKSTIPMPAGYQDTTWPLDEETIKRLRRSFENARNRRNDPARSWWVPLGTEVLKVGR